MKCSYLVMNTISKHEVSRTSDCHINDCRDTLKDLASVKDLGGVSRKVLTKAQLIMLSNCVGSIMSLASEGITGWPEN